MSQGQGLDEILEGASQAERDRAHTVFAGMLAGDPRTFPVQLALITKASADRMAASAQTLLRAQDTLQQVARESAQTAAACALAADRRAEATANLKIVEEVAMLLRSREVHVEAIAEKLSEMGALRMKLVYGLLALAFLLGLFLGHWLS